MSSQTIHVLGYATIKIEGDTTTERIYYAMSRVEMEQQRRKASKDGLHITRWSWQTQTGRRILGDTENWGSVTESRAPRVKLVNCDVCATKGCIVCNYSGITTRTNKNRWAPWQIERMRTEYGTV